MHVSWLAIKQRNWCKSCWLWELSNLWHVLHLYDLYALNPLWIMPVKILGITEQTSRFTEGLEPMPKRVFDRWISVLGNDNPSACLIFGACAPMTNNNPELIMLIGTKAAVKPPFTQPAKSNEGILRRQSLDVSHFHLMSWWNSGLSNMCLWTDGSVSVGQSERAVILHLAVSESSEWNWGLVVDDGVGFCA